MVPRSAAPDQARDPGRAPPGSEELVLVAPSTSPAAPAARADAVRPHHLVVLVLDDVAVPDELAGRRESRAHPRDLSRIRDDVVLDAGLPGLGRRYPVCLERATSSPSSTRPFRPDLERHLVDVHRVRIAREVEHLPDLGGTEDGFSVTASCHFRSVQIPAATVPRRASTGPVELLLRLAGAFRSFSMSEASRMRLRRKRRGRGQPEKSGRRRVVCVHRRDDAVLQDPPRGVGIRLVEIDTWSAPPNGSSGPTFRRTWLLGERS